MEVVEVLETDEGIASAEIKEMSPEEVHAKYCEMKSLLNEIGWSQAHFSRRIGVSEQTLCNWMKPGEHQGGYRVGLAYLRLVERLLNG